MERLFHIDLFANPEALFLLLLIPGFLFWYYRYFKKQRLVIRLSYDPTKLKKQAFSLSVLRVLPRALQLLSLAFMIVAVSRPQSAKDVQTRTAEGIDIMLLLDTSGSMESADFFPNRLEVAKQTAISFVTDRTEDQIGVVLFAEKASAYAPLTMDHDLIQTMIEDIKTGIIQPQGTAIGSAIAVGINRLRESETPTKIMILLTDGANNQGRIDPITAAKLAKEYDIRIYSIGVGSSANKVADRGTELDESTLRQIAIQTGGTYFRAQQAERLQEVFDEISQLEKRPIQATTFLQTEDKYPIFLQIAMVLLGISFLLMLTFVYNPLEQ
ncbi:MAG: VWA domain-containing protein [Bacteroidia bacterium]